MFVTAKVESGFMIQAAFGWPEVGQYSVRNLLDYQDVIV